MEFTYSSPFRIVGIIWDEQKHTYCRDVFYVLLGKSLFASELDLSQTPIADWLQEY